MHWHWNQGYGAERVGDRTRVRVRDRLRVGCIGVVDDGIIHWKELTRNCWKPRREGGRVRVRVRMPHVGIIGVPWRIAGVWSLGSGASTRAEGQRLGLMARTSVT